MEVIFIKFRCCVVYFYYILNIELDLVDFVVKLLIMVEDIGRFIGIVVILGLNIRSRFLCC